MDRQVVIWLTVAVYAVVMVVVGVLSSRRSKNMDDFTVGGRRAGAWMSAFSYGTAYFSAVMFIGYAGGTGWKYGLWGILPGLGNAIIGALLAWLVLAQRTRRVTRRLDIKSMPQLFEKRFDSQGMRLFCVAVIFLFLIPYSASVYKGLTSVCSVLLGVDETVCMIVIAVLSAVLVVLGGYVATLKADFVQGIVMIVGVIALLIAVVRCDQVGGLSNGLQRMQEETAALNLGPVAHIGLWATVLMTSFGTWGLPQMIHKYYGIRDDREVRRGTVASTLFALLIAGGGYFIGSLSHLFYTAETFKSLPGTDYLVPHMLASAGLSNILLGVVLVLLIAASVSTLSSITLTASSTLTMDFLRARLFPQWDSKRTALVTKGVCALFVAVSYFVANADTPILDMMSYSWGVISGSFLAPYALSLYWKGLNRAGGWAGMLGGFVVGLPPVVCRLFVPDATLFGQKVMDLGPHFACAAMVVSFVLCVAVSWIARAAGKADTAGAEFYQKESA